MHRLYKLINNDKFIHFVYGIAICAIMLPFGNIASLIVVAIIGIIKERIDKKGYGAYEFKDAAYTIVGGFYLISWHEVISYVQNFIG